MMCKTVERSKGLWSTFVTSLSKSRLQILGVFLVMFCGLSPWVVRAQVPNISYTSPQVYPTGTAITTLSPTNSGGAVPALTYRNVTTLASSGINGPNSITTDALGNVYIAATDAKQLLKVTPAGVVSSIFTFSYFPLGIAINGNTGDLYISVQEDRILKIINTNSANYPSQAPTYFVSSESSTVWVGTGSTTILNDPVGMAVDATNTYLYVVEYSGNRVKRIQISDGSYTNITKTSGDDLAGLEDIAIASNGDLYVSSTSADKIYKLVLTGTNAVISTFAGSTAGLLDGNGTTARFQDPRGLSFDAAGNLYVSDGTYHSIRRITPAGYVSTFAGPGTAASTFTGTTDGVGTSARFNDPRDVFVVPSAGFMYVAERTGDRIRKVDISGYTIWPTLPDGLSMNATTGVITGTPTARSRQVYYQDDFNDAAGNDTTSIAGTAAYASGWMRLTDATGSQDGAFKVNASGANTNGLQVEFSLITGKTSDGADGVSYSFAPDALTTGGSSPELGTGTGLSLGFVTYSSSTIKMNLYYGNGRTNTTTLGGTLLASNTADKSLWLGRNARISLVISDAGKVTVKVDGTTIFNEVQLPAGYLSANKSTWYHVFRARTGGIFDLHAIDDLVIRQTPGDATHTITAYNAAGSSTATLNLSVGIVPTISSFSPTSAKPGDAVTLAGNGFHPTAASNVVYLGATRATVTTATSTSLTVTVPVGATCAPVTVLNTGSGNTGASLQPFNPIYSPSKAGITSTDFTPKIDFITTGLYHKSLAIGDIDGDGKTDLVAVSNGAVSVFRNTSVTGSITSSSFAVTNIDLSTSTGNNSVAVGDLNNDGRPDLVVSNPNYQIVSIFRNTSTIGSIAFDPKVDLYTGFYSYHTAIGDLDNDGKPDLAVVNFDENDETETNVSVFRNISSNGNLAFATKVDFPTVDRVRASIAHTIAIGDLDGDNKLDLAVGTGGNSTVSVLRNTSIIGSITFAPKVEFPAADGPTFITIGDFNADGKQDLAVPNYYASTISILRNNSTTGTINFAAKVDFTSGRTTTSGQDEPNYIAIGDIDGDTKIDLAVSNYQSHTISVFRNLTSGGSISFDTKQDFTASTNPTSTAICDLDGDNRPDLVIANEYGNSVSILYNAACSNPTNGGTIAGAQTGGLLFDPAAFTSSAAPTGQTGALEYKWQSSTTGSSSGFSDIASSNAATYDAGSITQTTWFKRLAKTCQTDWTGAVESNVLEVTIVPPPTITSFLPSSAKPGDAVTLSGSGFNTTAGNNVVFFGATRATVTAATATSLTVTVPVGATYAPIKLLNTTSGLSTASRLLFNPVYSPAKAGINSTDFTAKVDFTTGDYPRAVAVGDIDGDGKSDIVLVNETSRTLSVYRNVSTSGSINTGSFAAKVDFVTEGGPNAVAIGDLDGDGKPDIAVTNGSGSSNTVSVFRNTSVSGTIDASSFASRVDFPVGLFPVSVVIADLDGDGRKDLAVANYTGFGSSSISLLRNTSTVGSIGIGSFADKVDISVSGAYFTTLVSADVDGDNKPDLAIADVYASSISVFRNTSSVGSLAFADKVNFQTGSSPRSVAFGDLDSDGKNELLSVNGDNSMSILKNTSTSGAIDANSFSTKVDFATGIYPVSLAVSDLDGNGKPDVSVVNATDRTVSLFRNVSSSGTISSGSFEAKVDFATDANPQFIAVGDLDGDARPDLAVANWGAALLSILRNTSCDNPTSGGTIAAPQSGNSGFDPVAFTSSVDASGHTGTIEYKWVSSITSSSTGFSDIPSSNSTTYDAGALTQTTWFKRLARAQCATDWTGAAESNVVEVTIVPPTYTWTGSTSTDWNTASNWSSSAVPPSGSGIVIPTSASRNPVMSSSVSHYSLMVESGRTLDLSSFTFSLSNNLTNNGIISATTGQISMAGTSAQSISGSGLLTNLQINKTSGSTADKTVTINSGAGNMQTLIGTLTPTSGTLATNGNLTLKSDGNGTARVGAGSESGGYIVGDVVTQRHLTKLSGGTRTGRAWRLVSVPVEGAGTLRDYFMGGRPGADLTVSGNRSLEPDNLGTVVIGHNQPDMSTATGAGYDWIGVANQVSSLRYYQQNAGTGSFNSSQVPTLGTPYSAAAQGYMLFARGDRKQQYNGTGNSSTTTLQATGTLKQGTKTVPIPALASAGYVLVGNPYMSVIDMERVYSDNATVIDPIIYIWDANSDGNSFKQGGYRTVTRNAGTGEWTVTGGGANPQYIESHAAFFVRPTAAGGTLQIKESHKVSGTPGIAPHGSDAQKTPRLFVNLEVTDTANRRLVDGAVVFFDAPYKEGLGDVVDIVSMANITAGAVGLKQSGLRLAMEGRPWPGDSLQRSIPVDMRNLGNDAYVLRLIGESLTKDGFQAWLKDYHLKTETVLKLDGELLYPFRRTGDAGIDSSRFEIVYRITPRAAGATLTPDDATEAPRATIFPNPSKTAEVKLSLRAMAPGTYTAQVMDIQGREVAKVNISHQTMNGEYQILKTNRLSPGQYIVRLIDADKQLKETLRMMVE